MIQRFILFCVFLILGALLVYAENYLDSYLLIVVNKTSIQMNLWFASFALLVSLLLLWLIWSLLRRSIGGIVTTKQKLFGLGDKKAQAKTLDGLIDYIEGNWYPARKKLTRAAGKVNSPLINYLAAARCAYELNDQQGASELLHKAESCTNKGALAVSITQARMHLGNQRYEQALAAIERASNIHSEHPVVLYLRQQAYFALKEWASLKALLPLLAKHNIGTAEERHIIELKLYRQQLEDIINRKLSPEEKLDTLKEFWPGIPSHLQRESFFLNAYIKQLMLLGEHDTAEKMLAQTLAQQWSAEWLKLYGLLLCKDRVKPLKAAEKWLKKHPDDPHLLLALGRLCLQNQQWGRSLDFFRKSIELEESTEAYAELARLYTYLGEEQNSMDCYKKGLLFEAPTLSDSRILSKVPKVSIASKAHF